MLLCLGLAVQEWSATGPRHGSVTLQAPELPSPQLFNDAAVLLARAGATMFNAFQRAVLEVACMRSCLMAWWLSG
jgi:hypothetical protein